MTALSVLSAIVCGTSLSIAAATTFSAPMTFVWTASNGLYSQAGTCLSAAAWTMTSTPRSRRPQALAVADVADQVAHARVVVDRALQLVLLELVAAEDADRVRLVALEDARR